MAEPAWKSPLEESEEPEGGYSGVVLLQRWVERPDGSFELVERPVTLEDYLDPQLEDKLIQGNPHALVRRTLADVLYRHFLPDGDVFVLEDVKVLFGPGFPAPGPDVSVIRGARDRDPDFDSFDTVKQGALPCLLIEVISPSDARVRRMDEVDKKALYERIGIPEYLLVDLPRRATGHRFRIRGYRLGTGRRYQPIEPDGEGRFLSETAGLRFGVSQDGQWFEVFVAATGERLLTSWEAEEKASREAEAREALEEELVRLRAEIERLKNRA
jgi:Uma2 family endonuclease